MVNNDAPDPLAHGSRFGNVGVGFSHLVLGPRCKGIERQLEIRAYLIVLQENVGTKCRKRLVGFGNGSIKRRQGVEITGGYRIFQLPDGFRRGSGFQLIKLGLIAIKRRLCFCNLDINLARIKRQKRLAPANMIPNLARPICYAARCQKFQIDNGGGFHGACNSNDLRYVPALGFQQFLLDAVGARKKICSRSPAKHYHGDGDPGFRLEKLNNLWNVHDFFDLPLDNIF